MQQALHTLEGWANQGKWVWPESALEQAKRNTTESIAALRERLAQPEQKPVAWGVFDGPNLHDVNFTEEEAQEMMRLKGDGSVVKPLYTDTQPQMQPCAGRNCGSTNPNLHSAECFEDYEKSTGVVGQDCDCPYLNIHDAVVKDNDKALSLLSQCLDEMQYAGWNKPCADQQGRWNVFGAVLNYLHPSIKSDT